jgi:energy-coupling factor transporter ATP-binding protein EcfA2
MIIKSFEAKKVNGYLDFSIEFNDELNFLIGINGSGKTTAINLMLGLISPSWFHLTQIKYDYAKIIVIDKDVEFEIKALSLDNNKIKLSISGGEIEELSSVIRGIDLTSNLSSELTRMAIRQTIVRQSRLEGNFIELDAVKEIRKLVTPAFLGLDRRIHKGIDIDILSLDNYSRGKEINEELKENLYESLNDIEELIKSAFLTFSNTQTEIGNSLKNSIIYSSFDIIESTNDGFAMTAQSKIDIVSRRARIIEASKNFEIPDLEIKISNYFDELLKLQKEFDEREKNKNKIKNLRDDEEFMKIIEKWFINSPQLKRIDNIISFYDSAQSEMTKAYGKFTQFEEITNLFFNEGNKTIVIKNGSINVILPNKEPSSIFKLSSGEKQILVMIAQLIFGEKREIFIIDEPELSLHLGWQEIFVESIMSASKDTQFILATHSPTIVGAIENEKYCLVLNSLADA